MIVRKTHEQLVSEFIDHVQEVMDQIKEQYDYQKKVKDDAPETLAHHTDKILKKWWMKYGY